MGLLPTDDHVCNFSESQSLEGSSLQTTSFCELGERAVVNIFCTLSTFTLEPHLSEALPCPGTEALVVPCQAIHIDSGFGFFLQQDTFFKLNSHEWIWTNEVSSPR